MYCITSIYIPYNFLIVNLDRGFDYDMWFMYCSKVLRFIDHKTKLSNGYETNLKLQHK